MASATMKIDAASMKSAEGILDQIDEMVRGPAISNVLRGVGLDIKTNVREVLPKPGYPGDKPEFTPLRETLRVKVKSYGNGAVKVLVVGYDWPEGAHGQPLEHGHRKIVWGHDTGGMVVPHAFLGDVVRSTGSAQSQKLIDGARKALERIKARG